MTYFKLYSSIIIAKIELYDGGFGHYWTLVHDICSILVNIKILCYDALILDLNFYDKWK